MRTGTRLGAGISTAVVLLAFYGSAHAQTPASPLPNLSLLIGERIEVTDQDRSIFVGQLIRASEASLVLEVDRKHTEVSLLRIREISRWEKDSVANGILVGTGLGFLIPALISLGIDTGEPGEAAAILIPPGLGIGMAVGWIVDATRHRKIRVFTATASRVAVVPMLAGGRKGFAVNLGF